MEFSFFPELNSQRDQIYIIIARVIIIIFRSAWCAAEKNVGPPIWESEHGHRFRTRWTWSAEIWWSSDNDRRRRHHRSTLLFHTCSERSMFRAASSDPAGPKTVPSVEIRDNWLRYCSRFVEHSGTIWEQGTRSEEKEKRKSGTLMGQTDRFMLFQGLTRSGTHCALRPRMSWMLKKKRFRSHFLHPQGHQIASSGLFEAYHPHSMFPSL